MEEIYKFALELILKHCENESYGSKEEIQMICEMALKESTGCGDCYCERCVDCTRGNEDE